MALLLLLAMGNSKSLTCHSTTLQLRNPVAGGVTKRINSVSHSNSDDPQ